MRYLLTSNRCSQGSATLNSLQIGLIAIGAFVVALLFVWHWWPRPDGSGVAIRAQNLICQVRAAREDDGAPLLTDVEEPAITAPRATLPGRAEPTLDPAVAQAWEPRVRLEPDDPPTAIEPEELPPDTGLLQTPPPASSGLPSTVERQNPPLRRVRVCNPSGRSTSACTCTPRSSI